jgi:hypothetical protein
VKRIFIADCWQSEIHLFRAACDMVLAGTSRSVAIAAQANAGTRSRQGIRAHPAWESIVRWWYSRSNCRRIVPQNLCRTFEPASTF